MEFYFFTLEKYYYSVILEIGLRRLNYFNANVFDI